MNLTHVSSKGQVVIPKAIREQLNLDAGTTLTIEVVNDSVVLKPAQARKKRSADDLAGMLKAHYKGPTLSVDDMDAAISRRIRETWSR